MNTVLHQVVNRTRVVVALVAVGACLTACGETTGTSRAREGTAADRATQPTSTWSASELTPGSGNQAERPFASINGPYVAPVGRSIELDASGSYADDGKIVTYEWDFDGDGVFDLTVGTGVVMHRFTDEFSGDLVVRVTDAGGRSQTAATHLAITSDGDEEPAATDNCPRSNNPGQEDEDHDGRGDVCDPAPGWPTEDSPGVTEGGG
jgi:hypothetical protein